MNNKCNTLKKQTISDQRQDKFSQHKYDSELYHNENRYPTFGCTIVTIRIKIRKV